MNLREALTILTVTATGGMAAWLITGWVLRGRRPTAPLLLVLAGIAVIALTIGGGATWMGVAGAAIMTGGLLWEVRRSRDSHSDIGR